MKFETTGPVAFDEMFESVIQGESWFKGQTMTLSSCSHKFSCT